MVEKKKVRKIIPEREYKQIQINRLLKNGEKGSTKVSKDQLKTLRKFYKEREVLSSPKRDGEDYSPYTLYEQIRIMKVVGAFIKKPYKQIKKEDNIKFIRNIKRNIKMKPNSVASYTTVMRVFNKWLFKVKGKYEVPENMDDPLLTPKRTKCTKEKRDLITKDEFEQLMSAAYKSRDKAVLMLLWEGGLRAGEISSLNYGSVEPKDTGWIRIWIEESKTEKKTPVDLVESEPYLKKWMNEHPTKKAEDALFTGFSFYNGERLRAKGFNDVVKRIAKRAGLKKKIHTHLFRHNSITATEKLFSGDTTLNAKRHRLSPRTLQDVYLHYSNEDAQETYLRKKQVENNEETKVKEKEEAERFLPKKCVKCSHLNPFENEFCDECGSVVDLKVAVELEERKKAERALEIREQVNELLKENKLALLEAKEIKSQTP